MQIGSYTVLEQLSESDKSRLFIGSRPGSDERFVLKTALRNGHEEDKEIGLRNEAEIARLLQDSAIAPEIFKADGMVVYARTYFEGTTLGAWMATQPELSKKLAVARNIATKVGGLHAKKLLHQDLSPSNILVNAADSTAQLIDYDLSTRLDQKAFYRSSTQKLEGSLQYMAPEQTGRMNRSVDYRADLYALGVILFELLTGRLPFSKEDPLEIIHEHLSKKPPQLQALQPDLPPVLNEIVQKLLNKNAEDRYQSALSLEADLAYCAEQLSASGSVPDFRIAALDKPLYFQIPEKLYGREAESKTLLQAFDKAAAGKKIIVTVGGYSGVGKSKLVHELHIPVTLRNGFFISGKFELIQRNTPYLAWIQAIQKFVEIILTEDRAVINAWKARILSAMGQSAGVITRLVPAIEQVTGRQDLQEDLTVSEDSARFNYAIRQFIKAIATEQHPLVLFLDDVQWADAASLHLLRLILTEPGLGYLLIITAYRDNEVSETHPFVVCLETSEREWLRVNETDASATYAADQVLVERMALRNLGQEHVLDLMQDTFKCGAQDCMPLAGLVHEKTKGNSFFVHKFLESLYEDGLIALVQHGNTLEWQFHLELIESLKVTDNVIDLMNRQIGKLPEATIKVLETASCLGYEFELHDLAAMCKLPSKQVEHYLFAALEADYIMPVNAAYKFVEGYEHPAGAQIRFKFTHDKIAQTFHTRLGDAARQQAHADAFRLMYERSGQTEGPPRRIFELAGHLNNAGAFIDDAILKRDILTAAGLRAKASSAFSLAYGYYVSAIDAGGDHLWNDDYEKAFRLHIEAAECSYQSGLYAETEGLVEQLMSRAKNSADAARSIEILVDAYFVQQRFGDAVTIGLKGLEQLGMKLPARAGKLDVIREFLKTNWKTRSFKPEDLLALGEITNKDLIPLLRLLPLLSPSAFFANTNLFVLIGLKMTVLTFRNGISSYGTQALVNYAYMLCAIAGKIPRGIAISNNVLKLLEQPELSRYRTRTKFAAYFFIEQYQSNVYRTHELLKETYKEGLEAGDPDFTAFSGNAYVQHAMLTGVDLAEIIVELRKQLQYAIQVKNYNSQTFTNIYFQFVSCLQGDAPDKALLAGSYFNPETDLAPILENKNLTALYNYHWYQACLLFFFDRADEALKHLNEARQHKDMVLGTPIGNYRPFMESVVMFCAWLPRQQKAKPLKAIKANTGSIDKLARFARDDYYHKSLFSKGMLLALTGDTAAALRIFENSIKAIDVRINRLDQAICLLVYARYCAGIGLSDLSELKQKESARLFAGMGAIAVSDFLEAGLAKRFSVSRDEEKLKNSTASASVTHQGIDMFSVVKSTQVISGEFDLDILIKKLLPLIIENAGAEKGVLMLMQDEGLTVSATADNQGIVELMENTAVDSYAVSRAVINYVINSGNPVILDHAHLSGRFVNDPYIAEHKVRSLLCMAIRNKAKLTGLLYLENNMVSGAFTQGRIEVLNILATQAAISIENATSLKHINELNSSYERFVPQSFLGQLEKNSILSIALGNHVSKNMSVLFADIRGFTGISEQLPPAEVFALLNEVWGLLSPIIDRHQGIIDKYIGDAVMALFPAHPRDAVLAAVEMQSVLSRFNVLRQKQGCFALHMGIGISSGNMILGTVGSEARMNTTVIGDTVNIASRLESLSKMLGAKILLTGDLAEAVARLPGLFLRNIGKLPLKGKAAGVSIFEEYSMQEEHLRDAMTENLALMEAMVNATDSGKPKEAIVLLGQYAAKVPADGLPDYYRSLLLSPAAAML